MRKIKEYAIEGKVINSNFKLGDSISNVIDKLRMSIILCKLSKKIY